MLDDKWELKMCVCRECFKLSVICAFNAWCENCDCDCVNKKSRSLYLFLAKNARWKRNGTETKMRRMKWNEPNNEINQMRTIPSHITIAHIILQRSLWGKSFYKRTLVVFFTIEIASKLYTYAEIDPKSN